MTASHMTFIAASYAVAAIAVLAAIAAIVFDYRKVKRDLERLGAPVDEREDEA